MKKRKKGENTHHHKLLGWATCGRSGVWRESRNSTWRNEFTASTFQGPRKVLKVRHLYAKRMESDVESEEEIEVTAAEVLRKLEEAWNNERFAPELLESKDDLIECMLDQIKLMEENLQNVRKGDLAGTLHKLEIDRIRFILCSYLRIRLRKIESHVIHVLEHEAARDPQESSKLSPEELQYAKEYADNMEGLVKSLCLQYMPPNMQNIDRKKSVPRPNLDSYVFLKILEDQNQVLVDPEEEPVDLEKGAQHILRYSSIAPLLANESVSLL